MPHLTILQEQPCACCARYERGERRRGVVVTPFETSWFAQIVTLSPELASSSTSTRAAAEVTKIALSPNSSQLAAGYSDGSVRLWDIAGRTCLVTLSGHSGAVTALQFSSNGALLASGSADTTLIMWDVVGEAGLCRFRGHKDAVTDLVSEIEADHTAVSPTNCCSQVPAVLTSTSWQHKAS